MRTTRVLIGPNEFASEFERCCREYSALRIAVAWCGDPKHTLPYQHIEKFRGKLSCVVGTAFNQTHPDAISWLREIKAEVRIFRKEPDLFHPKVYLFERGDDYALFLGSSNLTYSGFYRNVEVNVVVLGNRAEKHEDLASLEARFKAWCSDKQSRVPTPAWLERYRKEYEANAKKERQSSIRSERRADEDAPTSSWLQQADWDAYIKAVRGKLKRHKRTSEGYLKVLRAADKHLPLPWRVDYLEDIERRRIIGGLGDYGWLGHIYASGRFRHLVAEGTTRQRTTIVDAINNIAALNPPVIRAALEANLRRLVRLGFTMKTWGRLLTLVRPDVYCTVASLSVRTNLARVLDRPQTSFETPEGYTTLIMQVHGWPWFNSQRPTEPSEEAIWKARVAFLDALFYEGEGPQ